MCFEEVTEWQEEEPNDETFVNWTNRDRSQEKLTEKERIIWTSCGHGRREEAMRLVKKMHQHAWHRNTDTLAKGLARRQVDPIYVIAMKLLVCEGCWRNKRIDDEPVITVKEQEQPWETLAWDMKEAWCPVTGKKELYMVIMDEVTELGRIGKILSKETGYPKVRTQGVIAMYRKLWEEPYGPPKRIRYDEEGAHMSKEMGAEMSKKGIILDPVPGHAHWQNGKVERMIRKIVEASDKHMTEVGGTREEAVLEIMKVHNTYVGSK